MHSIDEYISDDDPDQFEALDNAVSQGSKEVTLRDGSVHFLPIVNTVAIEKFNKRRLTYDNEVNACSTKKMRLQDDQENQAEAPAGREEQNDDKKPRVFKICPEFI